MIGKARDLPVSCLGGLAWEFLPVFFFDNRVNLIHAREEGLVVRGDLGEGLPSDLLEGSELLDRLDS